MSLSVNIKHHFQNFDLDVSFEAAKGITMLYGRSGAGKTTIVNALAGLLHPNAGRIEVDGKILYDSDARVDLPTHRRRIGYIFQEGRLFPHLTVRQNLKYGRWFAKTRSPKSDAAHVIDMLGIGALMDRRPDRLSGGEKQRVAIGRALLAHPMFLLADEPLAALDDARKEEILPYFERLRDELEVPIVYVSHSAAEVTRLASTLVVLDKGRLLRAGSTAEVLSDPSITPLGAAAAGTLLEATLIAQHDDEISEISAGGVTLQLPRVDAPIGTKLRIRIEAQDIIIATTRPTDISALNVLPAIVTSIRMGDGPGALVQLHAGANFLLSRVTRRSVKALNLQEGASVFAVLKAVSIPRGAIGDAHHL